MIESNTKREAVIEAMTRDERIAFEVAGEFAEAQEHWHDESSREFGVHVDSGPDGFGETEDWKPCPECGTWFDAVHGGFPPHPEKTYCERKCMIRAAVRRYRARKLEKCNPTSALCGGTAASETAA